MHNSIWSSFGRILLSPKSLSFKGAKKKNCTTKAILLKLLNPAWLKLVWNRRSIFVRKAFLRTGEWSWRRYPQDARVLPRWYWAPQSERGSWWSWGGGGEEPLIHRYIKKIIYISDACAQDSCSSPDLLHLLRRVQHGADDHHSVQQVQRNPVGWADVLGTP